MIAESKLDHDFVGNWRLVETEVWASDALDLVEPARLSIELDGSGSLVFIAVVAGIDYRVELRDGAPCLEFTWEGTSEGDPICGRGWAKIDGDELRGRLYIHTSDDSVFLARRESPV